jgi:hypothetical protein
VTELNPNHPMTRQMHTEWHKIVALLMHKLGKHHAEITLADLDAFAKSGLGAVLIRERNEVIHLELVSMKEAERLARDEGGLPA